AGEPLGVARGKRLGHVEDAERHEGDGHGRPPMGRRREGDQDAGHLVDHDGLRIGETALPSDLTAGPHPDQRERRGGSEERGGPEPTKRAGEWEGAEGPHGAWGERDEAAAEPGREDLGGASLHRLLEATAGADGSVLAAPDARAGSRASVAATA